MERLNPGEKEPKTVEIAFAISTEAYPFSRSGCNLLGNCHLSSHFYCYGGEAIILGGGGKRAEVRQDKLPEPDLKSIIERLRGNWGKVKDIEMAGDGPQRLANILGVPLGIVEETSAGKEMTGELFVVMPQLKAQETVGK